MMRANGHRWAVILLLGVWLATAGLGRAADETPAPPSAPAAPETTATEANQGSSQAVPPPAAPTRPAVKPPSRPPVSPRPLKRFEPSEEIHVDKEVDFPADI